MFYSKQISRSQLLMIKLNELLDKEYNKCFEDSE